MRRRTLRSSIEYSSARYRRHKGVGHGRRTWIFSSRTRNQDYWILAREVGRVLVGLRARRRRILLFLGIRCGQSWSLWRLRQSARRLVGLIANGDAAHVYDRRQDAGKERTSRAPFTCNLETHKNQHGRANDSGSLRARHVSLCDADGQHRRDARRCPDGGIGLPLAVTDESEHVALHFDDVNEFRSRAEHCYRQEGDAAQLTPYLVECTNSKFLETVCAAGRGAKAPARHFCVLTERVVVEVLANAAQRVEALAGTGNELNTAKYQTVDFIAQFTGQPLAVHADIWRLR